MNKTTTKITYSFDYNQSLVSLATYSQSRLNSFQTVKTLFFFCIALPCIALAVRSKADETLVIVETFFFCIALAVRSQADETLVIVETLICPLQITYSLFCRCQLIRCYNVILFK